MNLKKILKTIFYVFRLNNGVMREYLKACGNGNLKDMTELKV
ncbi:hypothetical protein [Clostridium sp. BJN0013]